MRNVTVFKCVGVVGVCLLLGGTGCGDEESTQGDSGVAGEMNNSNASTSNGVATGGDGETLMGSALTYHRDVRPVLETHCMNCHNGTFAPASLNLDTPEQVTLLAPIIAAAVEGRTMPPWQAESDDCNSTYKDNLSLTETEIATLVSWREQGMALGKPDDFVMPTPKPSEMGLERLERPASINVKADDPYVADVSKPDDYRCFVVDLELDDDRFMEGFEVKVDNASILHHIVSYFVPGDDATLAELETLENEDDLPGYACFGGPRVDTDALAVVWAPGGGRTPFPENTGLRVKKGAQMVIQMHYNLSEGGAGTDQSSTDLWFYPEGEEPEKEATMLFVGNLPFQIASNTDGRTSETCDVIYSNDALSPPPEEGMSARDVNINNVGEIGKSGCVQQDFYYTLTSSTVVHGIAPHMHLYGNEISIEILPAELINDRQNSQVMLDDDAAGCMFKTKRYDFDWQRLYWFHEPYQVPSRGVVRLTCRYDNPDDEPVTIGEGSRDEMCLAVLFLSGDD